MTLDEAAALYDAAVLRVAALDTLERAAHEDMTLAGRAYERAREEHDKAREAYNGAIGALVDARNALVAAKETP